MLPNYLPFSVVLPFGKRRIEHHAEESKTLKLWLIMQSEPCGYSIFFTQDAASSNCSRSKGCPFGDILCLALNSCLIFRLLVLQIFKTAHKTLTSPIVTLRKLSTAGLLILTIPELVHWRWNIRKSGGENGKSQWNINWMCNTHHYHVVITHQW